MADAPFPDDEQGEGRKPLSRRRGLAAALVVLAAVSAAMIHAAAQAPRAARRDAPPAGKREPPRVLVPVESNVAVARVQARGFRMRAAGTARLVYLLDGPRAPKGDPPQDMKLKAVPLNKLGAEPDARLAEQVLPLRAAIVVASFPFKAQVEEHRAKLRLADAETVLAEQGPDGAPTFRFLGLRVQRRTLDGAGKPLTPYADLDLAAAYGPYLLLSGKRFEPERPPALEQVIFPGLVMPKLLAFRPQQYPPVEAGLKTLRKTLEQLSKRAAPPAPNAPGDANKAESARRAKAEVPPGVAKPRPDPFEPGIAKPRKAPPKAAPAPVGMPECCLLRVIDPTVQPGRTYQYRLQVRMANPNHGRKVVAAAATAEAREIDSDWYEVPQKVVVSPELVYYAVDQRELDGANHYRGINREAWPTKDRTFLQIHRWLEEIPMPTDRNNPLPVGEWVVAERVLAYRGEYVGFPQRIEFPYWRATQERFVIATEPKATRRAPGVPVSFRVGSPDGRDTVLVDFRGGRLEYKRVVSRDEDARPTHRPVQDSVATEMLLFTPDGKLLAPEGAIDAADRERKERLHEVRERLRVLRK